MLRYLTRRGKDRENNPPTFPSRRLIQLIRQGSARKNKCERERGGGGRHEGGRGGGRETDRQRGTETATETDRQREKDRRQTEAKTEDVEE